MEEAELDVIEAGTIEDCKDVFQLEDGRIFFLNEHLTPKRLYTKNDGVELYTELAEGAFRRGSVRGDALYLILGPNKNQKFYKAVFAPPEAIVVTYLRDKLEDEVEQEGFCTRERDGKRYTYHMSEDPGKDGIVVDLTERDLFQRRLITMHRRKFVYFTAIEIPYLPMLRKLSEKVLLLEAQNTPIYHVQDSSRYFYAMKGGDILIVFDTQTLEPHHFRMRTEKFPNIYAIVGVYEGVITMKEAYNDNGCRLLTANLPDESFEWMDYSLTMERITESNNNDDFRSEFIDKFIPIKIIGQGGFGCVFEAEFRLIGRRYAVKRIPLRENEINVREALKEVLTLDSFNHQGIVKYYHSWIERPPNEGWQIWSARKMLEEFYLPELIDFKNDCTFLYIQMELCGRSLADWLATNDHRSIGMMRLWFKQIVSAVNYIHQQNTMHRDLKPSNILVFSDEMVKICDLGIAAAIKTEKNGEETQTFRTNIGSELYKSPEQSFFYDERVDIFAMGLILLEMSTKLTEEQRRKVFYDIRCGKKIVLLQQPTALDLVEKLTRLDRDLRPTIAQILKHDFFTH